MNHDCNSNWWWGWQQRQSPSGMTRVITPLNKGIWSGRVTTVAQGINRSISYVMVWYGDLKMSKSSQWQWIQSIAYVAVFVVFFFYPIQQTTMFLRLLVKDAKHKHSFPNNFRTSYLCLNIFQKKENKEYTPPRDLWLITIWLCYLIIFTLIIIINWSYSYSYSVEKRRLLSISSINLLMHDPISISRHEKAKPRVLSSIYLANRSKINQFNVNVKNEGKNWHNNSCLKP